MKPKVAAPLLGTVLVFVVAVLVMKRLREHRPAEMPTMITQVRQLKQLVTVRYRLQQVVSMTEQKDPVGSESILLLVQGDALAGVDLAKLGEQDIQDVAGASGKVQVRLPDPDMTAVYLDEKQTKVWDRHVTWWTPWVPFSPDLETKARRKAIEDMRGTALQMGILKQAEQNARTAIRDLLLAFGIQVEFTEAHT